MLDTEKFFRVSSLASLVNNNIRNIFISWLHLLAVSLPQIEKICSQYACEAGAMVRSWASRNKSSYVKLLIAVGTEL